MKKYIFVLLALVAPFLSSCDGIHDDFVSTIWIDDPDCPGLPMYTEWGYNSFGAYVNGVAFAADSEYNSETLSSVVSHGDELSITLRAEPRHVWNAVREEFVRVDGDSISFKIPYDHINVVSQLSDLHNTTYDLASDDCSVVIFHDEQTRGESVELNVDEGTLFIKRVQMLYVDGYQKEAILSGTFMMKGKAMVNGKERYIEVIDGRFDLGVSNKTLVEN